MATTKSLMVMLFFSTAVAAAGTVAAQDGIYADALGELRRGRKTSHWMWFVFPQIAGLGHSAMAQAYASC